VCLNYGYYIYQNLLNFTYAFKCYHQNVSWLLFSWATLYSVNNILHVVVVEQELVRDKKILLSRTLLLLCNDALVGI